MIDVLGPVTATAHGGCVECDPNDARGDLYVFQLGSFKLRLCRHHLARLRTSIERVQRHEVAHQPRHAYD